MMRVIGPAHQLVSKPCEPDALRLTLRRACAIGTILSEGTLKAILSQVGTVPSPPALYLAIVKELKSEEPSVRRVGDIVATDPGMTAKILQLVNSAFFGFRKHVSEPHHAVSLLGLDTVTSLVLSVKIFAEYDPAQIRALGLSGLLRHSVRVGAYARIVASEGGLHSDAVDDAFAAGLLHDVGRLVLGTWLGEKSGIVAARIQHEALPFWEIERQVFNATHAQVGAYMMGLWGLPDELVEAVAFHHNPTESPKRLREAEPSWRRLPRRRVLVRERRCLARARANVVRTLSRVDWRHIRAGRAMAETLPRGGPRVGRARGRVGVSSGISTVRPSELVKKCQLSAKQPSANSQISWTFRS